jgi:hypothetical protein
VKSTVTAQSTNSRAAAVVHAAALKLQPGSEYSRAVPFLGGMRRRVQRRRSMD